MSPRAAAAQVILLAALLLLACAAPRVEPPTGCDDVSLEPPPCTVGCDAGRLWGIHDPSVPNVDRVADVAAVGAQAVRYAGLNGVTWDLVEKTRGVRDWARSDGIYRQTQEQGLANLAVVLAYNRLDSGSRPFGYIPVDMAWYLDFLGAAVERYDGDGLADAPGSPVVEVFEVDNEPDLSLDPGGHGFRDTPQNYALLLRESSKVIRRANPGALVAFGGLAGPRGIDEFLAPALDELERLGDRPGERSFDVVSFHWSGQFQGDYRTEVFPRGEYRLDTMVSSLRAVLAAHGYGDVPVWITEMSSNDGWPVDLPFLRAPRTELEQAGELLRRFVYPASLGVGRVFWITLTEWHDFGQVHDGYFDFVGLINNPLNSDGLSHKKLSYFTYRAMADNLAGADWAGLKTLTHTEGTSAFELERNGSQDRVYVAWADGVGADGGTRELTLTLDGARCAVVTEAVPSAGSGAEVDEAALAQAFTRVAVPLDGGVLTLHLGQRPVYVRPVR